MSDVTNNRRVKLYLLNENRAWDDQGIANVQATFLDKFKGIGLVVQKEFSDDIMLESKIQPFTAYQKQQETLIVWSEPDSYDYALSFQDKSGCDEIWETICQIGLFRHVKYPRQHQNLFHLLPWQHQNLYLLHLFQDMYLSVQGKDPSVEITQDVIEQESEEMEDDHFEDFRESTPAMTLPPCELSRLDELVELFNTSLLTPIKREKLTVLIENEGYVKKLIDLFHMCEDLENIEGLHQLYSIFKSLFMLNKTALFEIMFTDDLIFDVIGVLEYDPSLSHHTRHRDYLRTEAKLKEVIPLSKSELVQKIHQTYRVQYIQDVILPMPSVFEENLLSTLTSFIYFNKMEIVTMIQEDTDFLKQVFHQLVDPETDDGKRRDLLLFLKEFCSFSQTLAQQNKENFFKTLTEMGLLSMIKVVLGLEDGIMKAAAIDIFSYVVEFSPSLVRDHILHEGQKLQEAQKQQEGQKPPEGQKSHEKEDIDKLMLINMVISQMVTDSDPEMGGALQLIGIIRLLIDPENMVAKSQKTEKHDFLNFFYRHCMHVLTAPLFSNTINNRPGQDDYRTAQLMSLIIELLTFCIEHHAYNMKTYIANKNLLGHVLVLLKSKHTFLILAALRLLRHTIGLKDEFYHRNIIRTDLFKLVAEAFAVSGTRYNLFNSAVIELFEFIKTEDVKSLTTYFVEQHFRSFEHVTYVKTFKILKERHEQHKERMANKQTFESLATPAVTRTRFRRDARSMEEEEESWFNEDDENDDVSKSNDLMSKSTDLLKGKIDIMEYELLNNKLSVKNKSVQLDGNISRKSPPRRMLNKSAISINIHTSLVGPNNASNPASSPSSSPGSSPELGSPDSSPNLSNPGSCPDLDSRGSSPSQQDRGDSPSSSPDQTDQSPAQQEASGDTLGSDKIENVGRAILVDYPDEDSEEDCDDGMPASKKMRLST